jgi:hypothetical protein
LQQLNLPSQAAIGVTPAKVASSSDMSASGQSVPVQANKPFQPIS